MPLVSRVCSMFRKIVWQSMCNVWMLVACLVYQIRILLTRKTGQFAGRAPPRLQTCGGGAPRRCELASEPVLWRR